MAVDEARRYSRTDGLSRLDRVYGTSGSSLSSSSPIRVSWLSLIIDHIRHTATASTSASRKRAITSSACRSSSAVSASPSAESRSRISNVSARGI